MDRPLQSLLLKTLTAVAVGVFLLYLWPQFQPPMSVPPTAVQLLEGSTMGTSWQVQIALPEGHEPPATLVDGITGLLQRLDKQVFSTYEPTSELSRLNATPVGMPLGVSRELQEVLLLARTIHRQSFATFDVSVGELVNLWGFGPQATHAIPSEVAINAALLRLGAEKYEVDARAGTVTRLADITLDLSGIAKGYAVDRLAELLQSAGLVHFLVEVGGEVRTSGWQKPLQSWVLAIEDPATGGTAPLALIDTHGQSLALAGSGDYRNFFEVDGKRYSHELNPRTGRPVDHALAAVTVKADTAAEADAWATALMVLGPVDGPLLAEKRGMAAYFVIRGDQGWESRYTPGFEPFLRAKTSATTDGNLSQRE